MEITRYEELKRKLRVDKTYADVWTYFLDHFAENRVFMAEGEQTTSSFISSVLTRVAEQLFPGDGAIGYLLLTRIPEKGFIHGGFMMGGRIGGLFYFEETGSGLIAVADKPPSIEAKYARFSGYAVKRSSGPSVN